MIKRAILFTMAAVVIAAGAATASAQKWVDLGTKEVKDRSEQDTWHVGKGKGQFSKIKLFVGNRPIQIYRMTVKFENGRTQEIDVRERIRAGGETRAIDLAGDDRYIDKVDIWYEAATVRRGRRSSVTLWGIK
jgi:hypothetical protein